MRTNYRINSGTLFEVLSRDQLEELYASVLHLLEYTGMDVYYEEAREILAKAGAWVDGLRVCLPSYLVRRSLQMAPRSFTLFARDGNPRHDVHIGPGRAHFGSGVTCSSILDVETLGRRPYVRADAPLVAKIVDALPNIDFAESSGAVSDVHPSLAAAQEFAGMFSNTTKPIVARSSDRNGLADIHQIAITEAGGQKAFERRPNYAYYCEVASPLTGPAEVFDKLILASRQRVPLVFAASHMAAQSAPGAAASAIVQAAAESWMGLTLAEAIQPGLPFVMGGVLSVGDIDSKNLYYGAPELSLMMAGLTELAHYAGLPVWQTGGRTDSKCLDEQGAIEGSLSAFFSALASGDLCHAVGCTEGTMTGSVFQLVMMDEAIGYSRRITRGIEVNEDTLAVQVINHVGPNGHYLREPQTRRLFKTEFWFPSLCDRHNFEEWDMGGRTTMRDRAIARARDILASHQPKPIKPETRQIIEQVLAAGEGRGRAH